ncbi:MAG TPA: BrnA antitoxin family protein, partial [Gemmatimonas sp.]|nr:BrnA antitoxin family protein [Gemmatimonas sp.]
SAKPVRRATETKTPTKGRADLARLRRASEAEITRTSPPELQSLPDDFWQGARVVTPVTKQAISIRLDEDVIDWFRATGPKYQTRINAVLRSYVEQVGAVAPPAARKRRERSG